MEKQYYKDYFKLEREHWWFKARLKILEFILQEKIHKNKPLRILNAGAATGGTSVMLKPYGEVQSLEYDKDCSIFLSEILNEEVTCESLTDLPFSDKSYDLVCAFDVIEHIEDEDKAVSEIYRVLKDNGYVFLTVPTFKILWSQHDEINHHYRRYRYKELKDILQTNGFKVEYGSYFNFILFVPILCVRLLSKILPKKKAKQNTGSDYKIIKPNELINQLLYRVFCSEIILLKWKIKFPFGVSAMIIGKKVCTE